MKLHALYFESFVAQSHDDAFVGLGGDDQILGQRLALYNQRMVSRGDKRIRQSVKNAFAVVPHFAGLPVEEPRRANYLSAKRRAHGLVSQANSQYRKFSSKLFN